MPTGVSCKLSYFPVTGPPALIERRAFTKAGSLRIFARPRRTATAARRAPARRARPPARRSSQPIRPAAGTPAHIFFGAPT